MQQPLFPNWNFVWKLNVLCLLHLATSHRLHKVITLPRVARQYLYICICWLIMYCFVVLQVYVFMEQCLSRLREEDRVLPQVGAAFDFNSLAYILA